jgi:hypothetical protein
MLAYETMVEYLAKQEALADLSGGYGFGEGLWMVAKIYGKDEREIRSAIKAVYPEVLRKLRSGE